MKIFISWSGPTANRLAVALRDWLPDVIQRLDPYVSSEDLRKGNRWAPDIAAELDASNYGLVCLTRDGLNAPWVMFESGALSKSVERGKLWTILFGGLTDADVTGPLAQFQHTLFSSDDMLKLLKSINAELGAEGLDPQRLERVFAREWPRLEQTVHGALADPTTSLNDQQRPATEMIAEILATVRAMQQQPPVPQADTSPILCEGGPYSGHFVKPGPTIFGVPWPHQVGKTSGVLGMYHFDHARRVYRWHEAEGSSQGIAWVRIAEVRDGYGQPIGGLASGSISVEIGFAAVAPAPLSLVVLVDGSVACSQSPVTGHTGGAEIMVTCAINTAALDAVGKPIYFNGLHTLSVRAADEDGRIVATASREVVFDNGASHNRSPSDLGES